MFLLRSKLDNSTTLRVFLGRHEQQKKLTFKMMSPTILAAISQKTPHHPHDVSVTINITTSRCGQTASTRCEDRTRYGNIFNRLA